jgi:hypothetical protein
MKRFWTSLLALTLFCGMAVADVKIATADRVENVSPGYCSWCAIETLARHHKITSLVGLVKNRVEDKKFSGGASWLIMKALNEAKVDYKIRFIADYEAIQEACDEGRGAVVNIFNYPDTYNYHAITLTHIDKKIVRFVDSNDIEKDVELPRAFFEKNWDGFSLVLSVPKKEIVKKPEPISTPKPRVGVNTKPVTRDNYMDVMNALRYRMTEEEAARIQKLLTGER